MRIPWRSIDDDGETRGRLLGRMLGIHELHGVGIAIALWRWALEMSREGDFAGDIPSVELLAAACIWPIEDAARLAKALQQVGLIAMHPTLRVRGLDRYRSTWLKNHNYHAMSAKGRGHPPVTAEFTKQTGAKPKQTESQDEDEDEEVTTLSTSSTDGPPASVAVVFGHWKLAMKSPRSKLDEKRRRAIAARLAQGFTVDDLKRAIDGCAGDPFSMGQNDRHTKFNTIGLICRDAEHVERFMEKAQAPPSAIPKPRTPTPTERANLYADTQRPASAGV